MEENTVAGKISKAVLACGPLRLHAAETGGSKATFGRWELVQDEKTQGLMRCLLSCALAFQGEHELGCRLDVHLPNPMELPDCGSRISFELRLLHKADRRLESYRVQEDRVTNRLKVGGDWE